MPTNYTTAGSDPPQGFALVATVFFGVAMMMVSVLLLIIQWFLADKLPMLSFTGNTAVSAGGLGVVIVFILRNIISAVS